MKPEERRTLDLCADRLRRNRGRLLRWAGSMGVGLPALGYVSGALASKGAVCWIAGLSVGVALGASLFGLVQYWSGGVLYQTLAEIQADLAEGSVEAKEFKARAAARLKDTDVPAFFLEVEDGILFLKGAYLKEAIEGNKFPSDLFVTRRALHSGIPFGIDCMGRSLSAEERDPKSASLPMLSDGDRFRGTLSALDEALDQLKSRSSAATS